ncbi:hypothetical protein [Paraburkholderia sp.]|uniref:hypothetical protein n=1 Tax=Paraburkholderia sp. TaxID=1926495 RepID=UPI0025E8B5AC|nr:hypothetical protein [Paraburkholderia sp.]
MLKLTRSSVYVIGIDLAESAQELKDNPQYTHVCGGVDASDTWDKVTALIHSRSPKLIGLGHCAAMLVQGTVEEVSSDSWCRILDVNVIGTVCRHQLRYCRNALAVMSFVVILTT